MTENKQISMAASCIALRGVKIFLNAGRAAAARRASPPTVKRKPKPPPPGAKPPQKVFDALFKSTKFTKYELEALYTMYRNLVTAAQSAAPASGIGQPAPKTDVSTGYIDRSPSGGTCACLPPTR